MNNTNNLWNKKHFWNNYQVASDDYKERRELISNIIPDDVNSIIDIGCGKGEIINSLSSIKKNIKLLAVDVTDINKANIKSDFLIGSLPNIKVKDKSFDLVLCLEVLEHLSNDIFQESLNELSRIAKKYIIIGVPYRENLQTKQTHCNTCNKTFHIDGHLRTFNNISNLFKDFKLENKILAGIKQKRQITFFVKLKNILGNYYYEDERICPFCNNKIEQEKVKLLNRVFIFLIKIINKLFLISKKSIPYWIIGIYKVKES